MHGLKGERVLMRVYVEEQDKFDGHPLYERIVRLMRGHHFAGATAFRATLGFGPSSHVHEAHTFHLKLDQPIIIEAIDSEERIQSILPELDRMIGGGLITLERVRVIMYRKDMPPNERDSDSSTDITGTWRATTDLGILNPSDSRDAEDSQRSAEAEGGTPRNDSPSDPLG